MTGKAKFLFILGCSLIPLVLVGIMQFWAWMWNDVGQTPTTILALVCAGLVFAFFGWLLIEVDDEKQHRSQ